MGIDGWIGSLRISSYVKEEREPETDASKVCIFSVIILMRSLVGWDEWVPPKEKGGWCWMYEVGGMMVYGSVEYENYTGGIDVGGT